MQYHGNFPRQVDMGSLLVLHKYTLVGSPATEEASTTSQLHGT